MTFALHTRVGSLFLFLATTVAGGEPSLGSPCTLESASNCQLPADAETYAVATGFLSDLTVPPNGVVAADDFVPQGTTLTQLCVWGFYHDANLQGALSFDCMDAVEDEFRVRIYADDNALPGVLIGETLVTGANIQRAPAEGTAFEDVYTGGSTNAIPQGYTLTLDDPITTLTPGQNHWLEVTNNTRGPTDAAKTCWWNWLQHFPSVGDGYSASGANSEGVDDPVNYLMGESRYIHGSARMSDLAFCLGTTDGPLAFDPGPVVMAACWTCGDVGAATCSVETALECVSREGVRGIWNRLDTDCTGTLEDTGDLILGDICTDPVDGARVITDGLYALNTNCADTDGPSQLRGFTKEGGKVGHDMWFHYTATCTGFMAVNACPSQPGLTQNGYNLSDGVVALYHDPDNPDECVCPGDSGSFQLLPASDEGCNGIGDTGGGILERLVLQGECYTIRMTNWANTIATVRSGPAMFDVDCSAHPPPVRPQPELILGESGMLVVSTKNRYLSLELPSATFEAVRVTFVDLPPPYDLWNGRSMWVGEPSEVSTCSGLCGSLPALPTMMMAKLQCRTPTYRDWTNDGTVHVYHEGIVPGGTYRVTVKNGSTVLFSDPLEMTTARFGDTVETCSNLGCTPPDDYVGINDALAVLARFASVPSSISLPRADLEPACVDFRINIADVLHSIRAFLGLPYPFTPSAADPCDSSCTQL